MWWMADLAGLARATTFPPSPWLATQLAQAQVAGVYVVRSTRTVVLQDGSVGTRAEIEAVGRPIRGNVRRATLGVPGGVVGGLHVDAFEDQPGVSAGDVLFLFLEREDDGYVLADGFTMGAWPMAGGTGGADANGLRGQLVTGVQWDAAPAREDDDELPWDDAWDPIALCGGGR
jgi:hypothetical protein